jgi:hypothetical protein
MASGFQYTALALQSDSLAVDDSVNRGWRRKPVHHLGTSDELRLGAAMHGHSNHNG